MRTIRWALRLVPFSAGLLLIAIVLFAFLGRIERTVEARGEVRVKRYQMIRPQVSGLITQIFIQPGDRVQKDQPLVRLEDYDFQRNLITVRQNLNEARSRLQKSRVERRLLGERLHPLEIRRQNAEMGRSSVEADLSASRTKEAEIQLEAARQRRARAQKLSDLGLISEQDLQEAKQAALVAEQKLAQSRLEERLARARHPSADNDLALLKTEQHQRLATLEAEIRELEYQVEQWSAQLAQLGELTMRHTIRAGMDGVVSGSPMNELIGRSVQAGDNLFSVIDDTAVYFVTGVPEQAIVRVRSGQTAYVEIAGLPKQRFDIFRGKVGTVAQEPASQESLSGSQDLTLYPVQIQLQQPWIPLEEGRFYLRSGMQGVARIAYRRNVPVVDAIYDFLVGRPEVPSSLQASTDQSEERH
jgi:HlyD family secretion protein